MKMLFALILCTAFAVPCAALYNPGSDVPPSWVLDKLEQKAGAVPCIGSLKRWERRYSYKSWMTKTIYSVDIATIEFTYFEADKFEFKSGRRFYVDQPQTMLDDRSYRIAHGYYHLLEDRITYATCGPNVRVRTR